MAGRRWQVGFDDADLVEWKSRLPYDWTAREVIQN
jgi:hypothetical protein